VASTAVLALGAAGAAAYTFLPGRLVDGQPGTSHVANGLGLALADSITTKDFSAAKAAVGKHAGQTADGARDAAAHTPRHARHTPAHAKAAPTLASPDYLNPLRAVSGLILERIDMGVDFGGSGPVYALGDGVVTNATGDNAGWPGGGWITYQLTGGPAKGLMVYLAEDVTPTVTVGERVTPNTVIANMYNGGDGIETGWAMPDGDSALSQLPEAGGIGGAGPFPTMVGVSFDDLLTELGVPAAPNAGDTPSGLLPAGYLTNWGLG
jgi:murein DD-endopeptidase MepM/ murein hydrolase activator NlpD